MNEMILVAPLVAGVVALAFAVILYVRVKAQPSGNETMNRIAGYIREGAMAFLVREYKVLFLYSVIVSILLGVFLGPLAAGGFVLGAFLSLLAGFCGMKAATFANVRTTQAAALKSRANALLLAFDGGAVMGLSVAGLGLLGLGGLFYFFHDDAPNLTTVIHSFAVGASSIALFARIGGGIYTKAADVGADIAGKVIENIPEDDPRNPGVIADNVGDNVGDVAGMGADIYESMIAAIVSAMAIALAIKPEVLGALVTNGMDVRSTAVVLPLALSTLGLVISLVVILITRFFSHGSPAMVLRVALIVPPIILTIVSAVLMPMLGISQGITFALGAGAIGGALIGLITDYYTSARPIRGDRRSFADRRGHQRDSWPRGGHGVGGAAAAGGCDRGRRGRRVLGSLRNRDCGRRHAGGNGGGDDGRRVRPDCRQRGWDFGDVGSRT